MADTRDEARRVALAIGQKPTSGDAALKEFREGHDAVLVECLELAVRVETGRTQEGTAIHTDRARRRRYFATTRVRNRILEN